jgi:hypothetical protein
MVNGVTRSFGALGRVREGGTHRLELQGRPLGEAGDWVERRSTPWESKFDEVERHLAEKDAP